ncbi:MAG TPA: type II methionyl aminopeptidase [Candidatus Glassbacteria bacterium]|nr:type II methionyl aminopeptidase [Candidatus Glassbacteria bacterium]
MDSYDREAIEKFHLSGKILRESREELKPLIRENMPIIEVCEKAESLIRQKGGKPAFPCNVSINEITAHYTSPPNDQTKIPENSVVKVDMGVHIDGYVTDTAFTVSFNPEHMTMVLAAQDGLQAAIDTIHADMSTSTIGAIIEKTIRNRGFKPISNLTGHSVGRYLIHAGTSIPNIQQFTLTKVKKGQVYAIEPFSTLLEAAGRVENQPTKTIFRLIKNKKIQNPYAKKLLKYIDENFKTLPFAERWLKDIVPYIQHTQAFKSLLKIKAISGYPILVEASGKTVSQAEHTIMVEKDGCEVLT